ncbi:hypothetical protein [Roseicella aquatilis]|uniref:Uncharacterized protein n=1 Tax=Roseicella aquatilis TaxID=2527868 RepID=A0A4R4D5I1_9PROT|nr:hypothetical protein [Roseicella aquatilis]TCZ54572.1 hypothetical protein EXY23_23145 [Roseicella aquatilis]
MHSPAGVLKTILILELLRDAGYSVIDNDLINERKMPPLGEGSSTSARMRRDTWTATRAFRTVIAGLAALLPACPGQAQVPAARTADVVIEQCDFDELLRSDLKYVSANRAVPLCVRVREAVGFRLMGSELRQLVEVGMAAQTVLHRRGETVEIQDAVFQTLDIARTRGVVDDRDRFRANANLILAAVLASEGRVTPAVLLAALRNSRRRARILSDDGVLDLAPRLSAAVRAGTPIPR